MACIGQPRYLPRTDTPQSGINAESASGRVEVSIRRHYRRAERLGKTSCEVAIEPSGIARQQPDGSSGYIVRSVANHIGQLSRRHSSSSGRVHVHAVRPSMRNNIVVPCERPNALHILVEAVGRGHNREPWTVVREWMGCGRRCGVATFFQAIRCRGVDVRSGSRCMRQRVDFSEVPGINKCLHADWKMVLGTAPRFSHLGSNAALPHRQWPKDLVLVVRVAIEIGRRQCSLRVRNTRRRCEPAIGPTESVDDLARLEDGRVTVGRTGEPLRI